MDLLAAVVQDRATGAVLMLAWMNDEALRLTLETGQVHFWSRSRQELWRKGATSGNTLAVREVRIDCDEDAILVVADPAGPACHTGQVSCFYRDARTREERPVFAPPAAVVDRVYGVIQERKRAASGTASYTRSLLDGGFPKILAKIAEEHGELAAELPAGPEDALVHEAADLLFHVLVGLAARDVPPARVWAELERRFGTSGHAEKAARPAKPAKPESRVRNALVEDILGPGGTLARALPGWEHRPQQLAMAEAVAAALAEEVPLLAEAGTGTGKTLAYLVPAILSGKTIVVSTGTRTLQEQIHGKDVPLLQEHLGVPFTAAVLKGISNYLCLRKLAAIGDTDDPDLLRVLEWARATQAGDRGELAGVAEDAPAWKLVTTTPDARLGPRCPFFERCHVTQARRAAAKANLIIVNHHLFFADLALRTAYAGAQVLPPYDAVIFDEAHQIEDVATEHFGVALSSLRVTALVRDGRKALPEGELALGHVDRRADDLFAALRRRLLELVPAGGERVLTPEDLFDGDCKEPWFRLDAALEELAAHADRWADRPENEEEAEDAGAVARRAQALRGDLATVAERSAARRYVHWAEVRAKFVSLHASPIDVAPLLREHLAPIRTVVFTSATLTTGGRFDFVRRRLGLDDAAAELGVDSPFDYPSQALLYLPRDLPGPKEPAFAAAALDRIAALLELTRGRAFVLFTSHRALKHAAAALRTRAPHWTYLVQGESARPALLDAFQRTPGAVLLATSSFWEGVDVPGDALSLVILEKLPFAAPDDPITAARVRQLEEQGEDAFTRYQVPRAALALKQGFGRLIRRRGDRGIVAILDHRILTRGYGQVFLSSLPPAARTSSIEQARRWWERAAPAAETTAAAKP